MTIDLYVSFAWVTTSKSAISTSNLDNSTYLISHELTEIITDPLLNAWFTTTKGAEITDLCERESDSFGGNGADQYGDGLVVSRYWSKSANQCIPGGTSSITDTSALINQSGLGETVKNAVVWLIFWGSSWNGSNSTLKDSIISSVQTKLLGSDSSYWSGIAQYTGCTSCTSAYAPNTPIWGGSAVNTTYQVRSDDFASINGKNTTIDAVVKDSINHSIVPQPYTNMFHPTIDPWYESNIIYIVLPDPSNHSSTESGADASHDYYIGDATPGTGQPAPVAKNVTIFYGAINGVADYPFLTSITGHEIIECITDADNPPATGWWTTATKPGSELADECENQLGTYTSATGNLVVQGYYSNKHGRCIVPGLDDSSSGSTTRYKKNPNKLTPGPGVIKDAKVFLIFWGQDWVDRITPPTMSGFANQMRDQMFGTFSATYFSQLGQYGINPPTWGGSCSNTITPIPSGDVSDQAVRNCIVDAINNGLIPPPQGMYSGTNPGTNYYYHVILPIGKIIASGGNHVGADAYHAWIPKQTITPVLAPNPTPTPAPPPQPIPDPNPSPIPTPIPVGPAYRIYFAWVATKNTVAGTATDPQVYASREMLNLITNPELTGYKSGTNQLTTTCLGSMGAGNYTAYTEISNTWAAPFYSNANGSCILPNLNEPQLTPTNLFTKPAGGKVLPVVLLEQVFFGPAWTQQFSTANPPYPLGTLDDITQGLSNLKYFTDYYSRLSQYGIQDIELDAILWNPTTVLPATFTDTDIQKCLTDMFNPNNLNANSSSFDPTQSVTLNPSDFPVSSPTKATFAYLIFVDSTAQHASGAVSGHGYFDWVAPVVGNPVPGPEPSPAPGPAPGPTGGLDANGIQKLYPGVSGTEWYMDMSKSDPKQDNSFYFDGINNGVSTTRHAAAGSDPTYYNTTSSTVSYNSGGSGKTLRIGVYADGGKGQSQLHTWKEKPDFIYDSTGIRSHELKLYIQLVLVIKSEQITITSTFHTWQ